LTCALANSFHMRLYPTILSSILLCSTFIGTIGYSQSISPQSVTSATNTFSQSNGSISFTVGEVLVQMLEDSLDNTIRNGFIPASVITTTVVNIQEPDSRMLSLKVYPNPTSSLLTIDLASIQFKTFKLKIIDFHGKEILNEKYAGIPNQIGINTQNWSEGAYLLLIEDDLNNIVGKFKIIKKSN